MGIIRRLFPRKKSKLEDYHDWLISVFECIRIVFAEKGLIFEFSYSFQDSFPRIQIVGTTERPKGSIALKVYYEIVGIKTNFNVDKLSKSDQVILDRIIDIVDPDRHQVTHRTADGIPYGWSHRIAYFRENIEKMGGSDKFAEMLYQQLIDANSLWKAAAHLSAKLRESYELKERSKKQVLASLDQLANEIVKKPA